MSRQRLCMKWLSAILAAYLLLSVYTSVSVAAETQSGSTALNPSSNTMNVQSYVDVPDEAWFAEAVNGWIALGILRPQLGDKFHPESVTTRGDFAFLLAYSLGLTPSSKPAAFKDLSDHELAGYITALKEAGLAHGYPDGTFRPNAPVTRAEAASWIAAGRKLQPESQTSKRFLDVSPNSWYSGAVDALVKAGIVSGKSKDRFAPTDSISRAETIALLDRSFFSPSLIQDIRGDGTIMIDGGAYHADESLRGIFQLSNKAVLHNAAILFTADENKIISVEYLMIGYKGALAGVDEPLVLNAGGNAINGIVMIDADQITLANLEVKGDLLLGRGFQSDFLAYHVNVKGQTVYLEDFGRPKEQIANLEFQDSDLGTVVLGNSANVRQVNIDFDKMFKTSVKPTKVIRVLADPEPAGKSIVPPVPPRLPPLGVLKLPPGTPPPSGPPSLPPGIHLQVTDGAIIVTNSGGSLGFQAGQFGYIPNVNTPPVIVPPNPNIQFVPPPVFNPVNSQEERPPIDGKNPTRVMCENANCNVEAFVNSELNVGGTGAIGGIIVHSGSNSKYIGEKPIQKLILGDPNSPGGISFTGSANIENVTVNGTGGSITLNVQGMIGNLIVPPGVDPKSLFPNPGDLSKVASIDGVHTASFCSLKPSDPSCRVSVPPTSTPDIMPSVTEVVYSLDNEQARTVHFDVTFENASRLYYVVVNDDPDVTPEEVKEGTGTSTIRKGSLAVTGLSQTSFAVSLQDSSLVYYSIYIVAENGGRLSDVVGQEFSAIDLSDTA